ncbi:MAG: hypothetical protein WDW38_006735 [Sanguina aurantia]
MASQQGPSGGANQADAQDEPDSVDLELNGKFDPPVLERVREFDRPAWMRRRKPVILDPLEDYTEWEASGLPFPPDAWDTIAAAIREEDAEMQEAKNIPLDESLKQEVVYRRRLVQGTTPQDLTWLKLKAYHRGMDTLQALRQAPPDSQHQHSHSSSSPADHSTPQAAHDSHPSTTSAAADPSSTPAGSSHQQQQRQAYSTHINANVAAAAAAASVARIRQLLQIDYSEDSEWDAEWSSTSYLNPPPFREFTQARRAEKEQLAAAVQQAEQQQHQQQQRLELKHARRTLYTPEFLQERALLEKASQQRQQRSSVFWGSMGVALAVCGLRWVKRRWFRGGPPAAKRSTKGAKPQAA